MQGRELVARLGGRGVTAVCALIVGGSLAAPAPASAANGTERCASTTPTSSQLFDAASNRAKGEAEKVSFERTSDGVPRRTLYLDTGGYVVTVCDRSGRVHEERYEQLRYADGVLRPTLTLKTEREPGTDKGSIISVSYPSVIPVGDAERPGARAARGAEPSSAERLARQVKVKVGSKRVRTRSLAPGRPELLRDVPARTERERGAAPKARASYIGNKCYHESRVFWGVRRSNRTLNYVLAMPNSWMALAATTGAQAFPHVWNYCGWSVGSGLVANFLGFSSTFAMQQDGQSQVGYSRSATQTLCNPSAIACNWGFYSGTEITENDISIDESQPWVNGAVPGGLDFQSLVAHEFGHSWGFGDVYNVGDPYAGDHVMYSLEWNADHQRYLAYGDYMNMRIHYP